MKMKQVIEQTGLTDRAVRLYLEEGLICPQVAENYNGRKSIDFSDADVRRLRQIALLRQAEFSIADIRELLTSPQDVPQIVRGHIEHLSQSAEKYEKLIAVLETVPPEDWTLPVLCDAMQNAARANPVPQEDLQPPFPLENEKKTARFARRYGTVLLCAAVGALLFSMIYWKCSFYYSRYDLSMMLRVWLPMHINWFILAGLCGVLIGMSRDAARFAARRRSADVLTILTLIVVFFGLTGNAVSVFAMPAWLSSETTNPAYYLKTERHVRRCIEDTMEPFDTVFPARIPPEADDSADRKSLRNGGFMPTTKYYYAYEDCFDTGFDIAAEGTLPQKAYDEAKAAVPQAKKTVRKGDWTCAYYLQTDEPDTWENAHYAYLIFACNDSTRTVRYIAAYAEQALTPPYFYTMGW